MIIEKTFHVNESIEATKTRLSNIGSFRRQLDGMKKAYVTADGVGHFEFDAAVGFTGLVDVAEVHSDEMNQTLFCSYNGNMEVAGIVEYFAIGEDLTEVVLTLDYTIKSPVYRLLDLVTGVVDRFLTRQIRSLQEHLRGESRGHLTARQSFLPASFETPTYA